jgi:hypothetical protein
MLNFTTTDRLATQNGVKILTYGKSGVGKTVLSATAPAPIILSVEGGTLSLRGAAVPVICIRGFPDLYEAYSWLVGSTEARSIETVCLDSGSEISEVCLAAAKLTNKDPRKAYGEMLDQMLVLFKAFRDLPGKNVYISAKMEWVKDEATGVFKYGPSMPGQKLGPALPYLFDEVFHMGIGQAQDGRKFRFLQTEADFQYEAKDRSGALAPMEPPDLSAIITKIRGGR